MLGFPDIFSLKDRTAVVTGAAGGLGAKIAQGMAEAGAAVVIGDIDTDGLTQTATAILAAGSETHACECDVRDPSQARGLIEQALSMFGQIDILVNNAGIADPEPALLHETAGEQWHEVININLHGVFNCSQPALEHMVDRRYGKVINIASMWGLAGTSSVFPLPAYAASKGAVVNLTREMALQYAPLGINVNAICPGFYRTNLGPYDDPDFVEAVTAFTPAARIAEAHEIKGSAIYLASPASDFVNGLMLVADGGCMAK